MRVPESEYSAAQATNGIAGKLRHTEHGGKYVAGGFNKTTTLNGATPPNRVVIVQFESMAKVKAWWAIKRGALLRVVGDDMGGEITESFASVHAFSDGILFKSSIAAKGAHILPS